LWRSSAKNDAWGGKARDGQPASGLRLAQPWRTAAEEHGRDVVTRPQANFRDGMAVSFDVQQGSATTRQKVKSKIVSIAQRPLASARSREGRKAATQARPQRPKYFVEAAQVDRRHAQRGEVGADP